MNEFLLDTSAYSVFFRGQSHAGLKPYFHTRNRIIVPVITLAELRSGFAAGNQQAYNEQNLAKFLDMPNVDTVFLTDRTTRHYAQLFARLKSAGTPIGTNDMWIAALALEHDVPLLTLDQDFASVPELQVIEL